MQTPHTHGSVSPFDLLDVVAEHVAHVREQLLLAVVELACFVTISKTICLYGSVVLANALAACSIVR